MPTQKDFKRLVRARMQKTGEAYTAARAHLLTKRASTPATAPVAATATVAPLPAPFAAPSDYAALAGMTDAAVKKATGCTWDRWVYALDRVKAHEWPHRTIAEYVHDKYKTPDWWTQMVTVGYERIKGLREHGQRRGGTYEASRSRTFGVPIGRLYRAFTDTRTRKKWLEAAGYAIRTATKDRSMHITWRDGTSVELWFTAKGKVKSSVAVQHTRLADREAITRSKAFWGARLDRLGAVLAGNTRQSRAEALARPKDRR